MSDEHRNEDNHAEKLQLNLATHQRIAGRDYNEARIPDSIKIYLATTSAEQLDTESIDNERLFYYRFGLDVPKSVREQIIAIKQRHDFTDHEIRWLRHSGQLSIKCREVKLAPDRFMPVAGWVQLGLLSMVFGAGMLQIAYSPAPSWKQMLGQLVLAGVWIGLAWVLNRLYIAPWRVLKLAGVTAPQGK